MFWPGASGTRRYEVGGYGLLCLGEGDMLGEPSDEQRAHYRCGHIGLGFSTLLYLMRNYR